MGRDDEHASTCNGRLRRIVLSAFARSSCGSKGGFEQLQLESDPVDLA